MLFANPNAIRAEYPDRLRNVMSIARAQESRQWLSGWKHLCATATPLWNMPDLAKHLGVAQLWVKDESTRSTLASFKALGAPIALVRLILRSEILDTADPKGLIAGHYKQQLSGFTVISATDGNHGRALAAAAQTIGCECVIVLHANVSAEREKSIAAYGARIIRIAGNYDESVAYTATLAAEHGWQVVSDTSYDGYETVPGDVMQGYGTIAAEIIEQLAAPASSACPFTHVFLQGGVGGMAAGIASFFWEYFQHRRPVFVMVEPVQADCLYQSAVQGHAAKATGTVDSVMAGLACGETSPLAWRFLQPCTDFFMTVTDDEAVVAMKTLASGSHRDIPVVAGESGVAGLAALAELVNDKAAAQQIGLSADARVLIINTEGDTAPSVYQQLVEESGASVLARQRQWVLDRMGD